MDLRFIDPPPWRLGKSNCPLGPCTRTTRLVVLPAPDEVLMLLVPGTAVCKEELL